MSTEDTHQDHVAPVQGDDNPFIAYSDNASSNGSDDGTSVLQFLRSSPQTREHLYRQIHGERATWMRTIAEKNFTIRTLRTDRRSLSAAHANACDLVRKYIQERDSACDKIASYEARFGPNPDDDGPAKSVADARSILSLFADGMLSSLHTFATAVWNRIFATAVWNHISRIGEGGAKNTIQALSKRVEELEDQLTTLSDERMEEMESDIENILSDGRVDQLEFDFETMDERLRTLESL